MPIMPTATGLFAGLTLDDLYARTLDRLKQAPGNYDRYPQASIRNALIDSEVEAAGITKCIKGFAFIVLKQGYNQYRPPSNMLTPTAAFLYKSNTNYWELDQKTRRWLDRNIPGWRVVAGDPTIMFMGDNYGNLRKIGFYPRPDTDSGFEITPDTGAFETGLDVSGNITGLNSAASATVCTDSAGRTLSDEGVKVGQMAINVTDGSSGQISAVSGSTFTATLTGGTGNTWAIGDSWAVLAGEYGVVTSWDADESYVFTTDYGVLTGVTQENNVFLEYIRRPAPLSFGAQYPEIPPELHQYLPDNAVYLLKRNAPKGSQDSNEALMGRQAFLMGIEENYEDLDSAMEDDPPLTECDL